MTFTSSSPKRNSTNGGANLDRYAYAYSNHDVRTGVMMQHGAEAVRQVAYAYDGVDQLTGEQASGGAPNTAFTTTYAYDAMGNRTQVDRVSAEASSRTVSASNELNQLTGSTTTSTVVPMTSASRDYDAAGNLTQTLGSDGSKTLYSYDDADRLTRLERRNASGVPVSASEWVYDFASRKPVSREFSYANGAWAQTSEKRRVFDGMDVVQERNAANEVTAQLVRSGNIGGILSRTTGAGAAFYGYDGSGNVTLLTDATGADVAHYRYDAFGQTLEASGTRASENPYRFSTKELHAASGLYDFGYRFYSASAGRWLNRDPLREGGGVNLYGMVGNDPINSVDHYGENPLLITGAIGVVSGGIIGAGVAWYRGENIAQGALKGAVIGGVVGLTGGLAGGFVYGGVVAAGGTTVAAGVAGGVVGGVVGDAAGQGTELVLGWRQKYNVYQTMGAGVFGGALGSLYGAGREIKLGPNWRIAPFGNRTGHPEGELPHYHRRVTDPVTGDTLPGQGIGRHRPWEVKSPDTSWVDRW